MPCSMGGGTPGDAIRRARSATNGDLDEINRRIDEVANILNTYKETLDELTARYCRLSFNVVNEYGLSKLQEMITEDDLNYIQEHDEEDIRRVTSIYKYHSKKELAISLSYLENLKKQGEF